MLDMNYVQDFEVVFCYRKSLTFKLLLKQKRDLCTFLEVSNKACIICALKSF